MSRKVPKYARIRTRGHGMRRQRHRARGTCLGEICERAGAERGVFVQDFQLPTKFLLDFNSPPPIIISSLFISFLPSFPWVKGGRWGWVGCIHP